MLGFAGLPPTGGFVGKFYAFAAAYRHGWAWLVVVGVVATAVSLVYYLDVIRALFCASGRRSRSPRRAARRRARHCCRSRSAPASSSPSARSSPSSR